MSSDSPTGPVAIDPSWWAPVLIDDDGNRRGYRPVEELSTDLQELWKAAQAEEGEDSLRTQVLAVLMRVTSAMLAADNWAEPFEPAWQLAGQRAILPKDLSQAELELLARLVPLIDDSILRARAADVAWTYGFRGDMKLWNVAVEGYRSLPLEPQIWLHGGRDGWRRALELMVRRGRPGREAIGEMATQLADFLLAADETGGFMLTGVSALLGETRNPPVPRRRELAEHFVRLASAVIRNHRLTRAYEQEAAAWFLRGEERDLANGCRVRIAQAYADEADARLAWDNSALVAGTFIEKAIAVLVDLPRRYRSEHGLDTRLQQLRERLAGNRRLTLEEMQHIQSDSIDITEWVERARGAVAGKQPLDALVALAGIALLTDSDQEMTQARARLQNSITRLFSSSTFSADGRRVAARSGLGAEAVSDDTVFGEVVRSFAVKVDLAVDAQIRPAHEVAIFEHRFDMAFLAEICVESPTVPRGHAYLWTRGLWHGLTGDFPSAISLLVPQIEQMVRSHLKSHNVFTLHVDEAGVETEKSLNALLEMPQANELLGTSLTFELRALLCEQLGPNLRNELAHGLLNDPQAWGPAAVYAWWLCLRMVVLPYYMMIEAAQHN